MEGYLGFDSIRAEMEGGRDLLAGRARGAGGGGWGREREEAVHTARAAGAARRRRARGRRRGKGGREEGVRDEGFFAKDQFSRESHWPVWFWSKIQNFCFGYHFFFKLLNLVFRKKKFTSFVLKYEH